MTVTLYDYWRSSAAYRVRIALNLKGLAYKQMPVNLVEGAQTSSAYLTKNPQGRVPALEHNGALISQSPAILEYLEDIAPHPALLPSDPLKKAWVRSVISLIACDIHPLQNLSVLRYLKGELAHDDETAATWARHWNRRGLKALDDMLKDSPFDGPFLQGPAPGMADIYLVPQVYGAERFGAKLDDLPRLMAHATAAREVEEFAQAAPEKQPDAPKS